MSQEEKKSGAGVWIRLLVLLAIAGVVGRFVYVKHVPALYTNRGVTLADEGKPAAAMAEFEKALQINPNFQRARDELGRLCVEQAEVESRALNFPKVVSLCKRAISLGYHKNDVHFQLGWAYWRLGKKQSAIEQFKEQERYRPDDHRPENMIRVIQKGARPSWDKTKVK